MSLTWFVLGLICWAVVCLIGFYAYGLIVCCYVLFERYYFVFNAGFGFRVTLMLRDWVFVGYVWVGCELLCIICYLCYLISF